MIPVGENYPTPAPTTTDNGNTATYTVKAGDMLEKIANRHGTTVKAIMTLNDMKSTKIMPGQKLKMPASKTPDATTSPDYVTPLPTTPPAPKTNP